MLVAGLLIQYIWALGAVWLHGEECVLEFEPQLLAVVQYAVALAEAVAVEAEFVVVVEVVGDVVAVVGDCRIIQKSIFNSIVL